jgi:hypothetical protein
MGSCRWRVREGRKGEIVCIGGGFLLYSGVLATDLIGCCNFFVLLAFDAQSGVISRLEDVRMILVR